MDAQANAGWADRLGSTARVTLIVIAAFVGLLAISMLAGFSVALYEDSKLPAKPFAYIFFGTLVGLIATSGWFVVRLVRSVRPETVSRFDRRYWTMWIVVVVLSLPIGIGLAMLGLSDQSHGLSLVVSSAPIAPWTAIVAAVLLLVLLAAAAVYYHRTVDDHEERAYLWGSTIAFYFLVTGFPLHWLLARGGIVPALTIGSALLLVLVACIVQAIAWAMLKFR